MKIVVPSAHNLHVVQIDKKHLDRVRQHTWHVRLDRNNSPYVVTKIDGSLVYLHKFILNVTDGQVDHRDLNTLDNRERNLRPATSAQNNQNRSKFAGCSSVYKGVSWHKHKDKWQAEIMCNYQKYNLGYFMEEVDAARAYNEAAIELFGEFARLNEVS